MKTYFVRDTVLAQSGYDAIGLAELQMGALMRVRERFAAEKPLNDIRIGMALHITRETAVLARTLVAGGAEVWLASCNPLSTQDETAAALAMEGVHVFGYKGETEKEYYEFLHKVLAGKPHITIDDGGDLVTEIHTHFPELLPEIIGGCEETTTGIIRLRAMEREGVLRYPVIAVNDNKTKHLMDNYYGTGQSTLDGIMRASNFLYAGKTVVVAGYGSCGRGIALRAEGLGARIIITEVEPFRALQAAMDGHRVMTMEEAAPHGDLFITVTGNTDVITPAHVEMMKDGALLANSGHFDVEIDVKGLREMCEVRRMRPFMDEYTLSSGRFKGKRVYVLGEGRLINLAAAEGHPSEIMSMSFCGQALACEYLVQQRGMLSAGVHVLPAQIDTDISRLQLEAMGIQIDTLSAGQTHYLESWQSGT